MSISQPTPDKPNGNAGSDKKSEPQRLTRLTNCLQDSPVFLGIRDSASGIMLTAWNIPSENGDDIARCLSQTAEWYGRPGVLKTWP